MNKQEKEKQEYKSLAMKAFIYGIKSAGTEKHYPYILKQILNDFGFSGNNLDEQAEAFIKRVQKEGIQWIQNKIMEYVSYQKKRILEKDLQAGTLRHYIDVIKLFLETNDELLPTVGTINWKKIRRPIPKPKTNASDRAITKKEIRKLLEAPDRRLKPLVLVMSSTGLRLGAWQDLSWKHVEAKYNEKGEVIAAKLTIYENDAEEYYSFMTAEAFLALDSYIQWRASLGEEITGDTPLLRDILPESDVKKVNDSTNYGLVNTPIRLSEDGLKKILIRALWAQGLRKQLPKGVRRYPYKLSHSFRKFYETTIEDAEGVKPMYVAQLMNHRTGMPRHYRRPPENKVLEYYLKVADSLTIYDDKVVLQKQIAKTAYEEAESLKKRINELETKQANILLMFERIKKGHEEIKENSKRIMELNSSNNNEKD